MSSVFSDYVRSLGPEAGPPKPEVFDELLETLRRALVHELKKRSLWSAPPSYLGVYGGTRWTEGDVLEDLLLDCYAFIFVRRLAGLRKQQKVRPNIDGLIFLNIRHFLHNAQKRHDPLGFRVFEVLQAAVLRLVDAGVLHLLAGDAKIRNDTILGFASWNDPRAARGHDLRSRVESWNDRLLPDLITAWSTEGVRETLAGLITGLPADGVEVFQFRDLIVPMKEDARARWNTIQMLDAADQTVLAVGGDDSASIIRWVPPDLDFEARQLFRELLECVAERLEKLAARKQKKEYLNRFWLFLRNWAAEPGTAAGGGNAAALESDLDDRLPPAIQLGKLLKIPRERIPGLKATLGRVVSACQDEVYGRAGTKTPGRETYHGPTTFPQPSYASGEGRTVMDLKSRREQLRLETGKAAASLAGYDAESAARKDRSPRPGETFVFTETSAWPVEWLFVRTDPADEQRALVAPVDDNPLAGRRDAVLGAGETDGGAVRCGCGTWIDVTALGRGVRCGNTAPEVLERLLRQWLDLADGGIEASAAAREVESDPEYLHWMKALGQAQMALPGNPRRETPAFLESRPSNVVPFRRRWIPRLEYGLAAGFAAAAAGLSVWVGQLRNELSEPVVFRTSKAEEIFVQDPGRPVEDLTLTASETHVLVYVLFSKIDKPPTFRLELASDAGRVLWQSPVMATEPDDQFLLAIPRRLVTAGRYRIQVFAPDEGGVERLVDGRDVRIELP